MSVLDVIYEAYGEDPLFQELRAGATQLVRGYGCQPTDILFVGEAPGAEEDKEGRPFVGASGRVLDKMLAEIGVSREPGQKYRAFITNIVKYRPPNNRDPFPDEVKNSLPYLIDEIRELKAKIIVSLGSYSTRAIWPESPIISRCHGVLRVLKGGFQHMPMYHPAVSLYDPRKREVIERDFTLLGQILEEQFS